MHRTFFMTYCPTWKHVIKRKGNNHSRELLVCDTVANYIYMYDSMILAPGTTYPVCDQHDSLTLIHAQRFSLNHGCYNDYVRCRYNKTLQLPGSLRIRRRIHGVKFVTCSPLATLAPLDKVIATTSPSLKFQLPWLKVLFLNKKKEKIVLF